MNPSGLMSVVVTLGMPVFWLLLVMRINAIRREWSSIPWRAWLYITILFVFVPGIRIAVWIYGEAAVLSWPPVTWLQIYYSLSEAFLFYSLLAEAFSYRSSAPALVALFFVLMPATQIAAWPPIDRFVWNTITAASGLDSFLHAGAIAVAKGTELKARWEKRDEDTAAAARVQPNDGATQADAEEL